MALFGEIVESSSRALFDDDSSEDEQPDEKFIRKWELHWHSKDSMPTLLENVLVFQGRLASDFLQYCILKADQREEGDVKEVVVSGKMPAYYRQPKPLLIYKLTANIYGCSCPEVDHDDCNIILDALLPLLTKSKQVTILTSAPAPLYKCNNPSLDLPPSFMRVLYSASFNGQEVIAPILEHPNIVPGIAAAVLSWCEVFKVPGCMYICYSDSEEVDSISAEPLLQIFSKCFANIVNIDTCGLKSKKKDLASNLYM